MSRHFPGWDALYRQHGIEPNPTRPRITSLHKHAGCGHDCLSTVCLPVTNRMDPLCPYCQTVGKDRRGV